MTRLSPLHHYRRCVRMRKFANTLECLFNVLLIAQSILSASALYTGGDMASALDRVVVVVNTITTLTLLSFNRLAQEADRHNTQLNKCIAHNFGGGIPRVPHTNAIYSRKGGDEADDGAEGGAGNDGCVMHPSLVASTGIAELDEIAFLVCDDTASVRLKVRTLRVL